MNNVLIITAAGSGKRMNAGKNKLLIELSGKTIIERCVEKFSNIKEIKKIIVTVSDTDLVEYKNLLNKYKVDFVIGGLTRQQSVFNAVKSINNADLILIHDGARPFVDEIDIQNVISDAKKYGAAALGVKVKDTIKIVKENNLVDNTPKREALYAIQTPQVFDFKKYCDCMEKAEKNKYDFTDDCQLFEINNIDVKITEGSYNNIKITTPDDIGAASQFIK